MKELYLSSSLGELNKKAEIRADKINTRRWVAIADIVKFFQCLEYMSCKKIEILISHHVLNFFILKKSSEYTEACSIFA